jgi:ElaB/YqjD/DUF883 family membrane-anchored ribosome-binding protein
MNEQDIKGALNGAADEVQAKSGQAQAMINDVADKVTSGIAKAGDQASAAVNKFSDVAIDAYDRAYIRARKAGETVEPFVRERPYAALAISAALGLVIGLLTSSRGPKVVYVRPPN